MPTSPSVERVHLPRRSLLGGNPLGVHKSALFDAHEQRIHRALGDVCEATGAQPRGDLVSVRRPACQECQHDTLEDSLEDLGHLLALRPIPNYSTTLSTARQ